MFDVLIGIIWFFALVVGGARILRRTGNNLTGPHWLAYGLGIGIALASLVAFIMLLFGNANAVAFGTLLLLVIVAVVLDRAELSARARGLRAWFATEARGLNKTEAVTALVIVLLLAFQLLTSFAPPTTNPSGPQDFDSLNYHLLIPKAYLNHGAFVAMPWLPQANWPTAMESVYMIAMSLGSEVSARVLSCLVSITLVLFLYAFARRWLSRGYALIATAVLLTTPVVGYSMGTGYVDLALAFFVLLTADCLIEWRESKDNKRLALAAWFIGLAVATKLIGAIYAILAGAAIYLAAVKKNGLAKPAIAVIAIGLVALVVAGPWLARDLVDHGSPVWPLQNQAINTVFHYDPAAAYFNGVWAAGTIASGMGHGVLDLIALPWNLSMHGREFGGAVTPLLLALLPLLLFVKRERNVAALAIFGLVAAAAWFFTYQDSRFLLPAIALLCVPAAYAAQEFFRSPQSTRVFSAIVIVLLVFSAALVVAYKYQSLPAAVGLESRDAFLARTHATYAVCQFVNANTPAGSVVAFYGTETAYYCDRDVVYSTFIDYGNPTSAGGLLAGLRHFNATHVVVNEDVVAKLEAEGDSRAPLFKQVLAQSTLEFEANGLKLYELPKK